MSILRVRSRAKAVANKVLNGVEKLGSSAGDATVWSGKVMQKHPKIAGGLIVARTGVKLAALGGLGYLLLRNAEARSEKK